MIMIPIAGGGDLPSSTAPTSSMAFGRVRARPAPNVEHKSVPTL